MPVKAATTAFLWRFGITNFKAAYGRYSQDTEYAKNYFQTDMGAMRDKLVDLLGHSGTAGEDVPLEIRWPGGHFKDKFSVKNTGTDRRGQVYITKGTTVQSKAVTSPFVPGDPHDRGKALTGDSHLPTAADANALLQSIQNAGTNPWWMLVALEGEQRILHARMILENPPPGKEHLGLDQQPKRIRDAIRNAAPSDISIFADLAVPIRADRIVAEVRAAFERSPNVLLVGPPGCGKTVAIEDFKNIYAETAWFDADSYDSWRADSHKVYDTAFRPTLSYESFVAGIAPAAGRGIRLEARSGPLVDMAQWCRDSDREGLLLIDEFNRGPAAAIFGDTLVLLDKHKRSGGDTAGSTIAQPHSSRDIDVPREFASATEPPSRRVPKSFSLPHNLRIIGAFNGSDRSVAALDAALLRRFSVVRVDPDPDVLARHLGLDAFDQSDRGFAGAPFDTWSGDDVRRLAVHLLVALNERIRLLLGSDHQIGHALLWEVPVNGTPEITASALAAEFEEKVVGRLSQTLRDKDDLLAAILNAPEQGDPADDGVAHWLSEDTRIGRLVGPRLQISNLKNLTWEEQLRRLAFVAFETAM